MSLRTFLAFAASTLLLLLLLTATAATAATSSARLRIQQTAPTSSLESFVTALDRKLTAFIVSSLAQVQAQRQYFSAASSGGGSSSAHAFARQQQLRTGRGYGRALFDSDAAFSPSVSSFVLVDPRTPQAFPLLGIFGFPLPLLHQLALVLVTLCVCAGSYLFLREAVDSTHSNFLFSALSGAHNVVMTIMSGNAGSLGSVGLSSDFPARIANAVSSGLAHAFPSSAAQHSFGTAQGANGVLLAPNGKGRALRRSKLTAPSYGNGNGSSPAAAVRAVPPSQGGPGHYPGIRNTGNTCFFNSVIQSLASCPTLVQHLDHVTLFAEAWDVPTPVTDALRDIVTRLNSPAPRRPPALLPHSLTSALSTVSASNGLHSLTGAHQQQDAHELFAVLSDALESELREIQRERRSVLFSSGRGLAAAIAPTRARSAEWVVPDTPPVPGSMRTGGAADEGADAEEGGVGGGGGGVVDEQPGDPRHPFKGWTAQRTGCVDCGYTEGIRHLASEELTLTVPQLGGLRSAAGGAAGGVALEQLLDEWSKLEVVQWICHRCSVRATAERVRAEVVRLGGDDPALRPAAAGKVRALANGHHHDDAAAAADGDEQPERAGRGPAGTSGTAMTVSKKKRLREAQRTYDKLLRVLELNIHEDELAAGKLPPPLLLPADLKLERVPSRCATKQIMLARPPPVLVIHLNRSIFGGFGGGASKNNTFVHFGEWLDMEPFATGAELEVRSDRRISSGSPAEQDGDGCQGRSRREYACLYRLQSIVVHYGGHSFGHYVAYRRTPPSSSPSSSSSSSSSSSEATKGRRAGAAAAAPEWMRISDDIVEPCGLGDVLASNPFLLFYERWHGPLPGASPAAAGPGSGSGSDDGALDGLDSEGGGSRPRRQAAKLEAAVSAPLDDIDGDAVTADEEEEEGEGEVKSAAAAKRAVADLRLVNEVAEPTATPGGAAAATSTTTTMAMTATAAATTQAEALERLRSRVRPRVVQRWESPAPRAAL